MNERNEFWARVNASLDARREPLDDARIQYLLERAPELLDELAALNQALEGHMRAGATAPRPRAAAAGWLALAAGLAVIVAISRASARRAAPPRAETTRVAAALEFRTEPVLALLELRATLTRRGAHDVEVVDMDVLHGGTLRHVEQLDRGQPPTWLAMTLTTSKP